MSVDWQQALVLVPIVGAVLNVVIAVLASAHVILNKRDTRSATAWVGLIMLVPFIGALLYIFLGINRIQRRAKVLKANATDYSVPLDEAPRSPAALDRELGSDRARLVELARVVGGITERPLLVGNQVQMLVDGDEAYPAMIEAIRGARESVTLVSYIFEAEGIGEDFIDALLEAQARGAEVRVLIDDVGTRYSRPAIDRVLRKRGIPVAEFLPALLPKTVAHFNLRNHCKILVIDGQVGFTGGINIRQDSVIASDPSYPTLDLHFRLEGPVVAQLQDTFASDWSFTTGEKLVGRRWFPELSPRGDTFARGITDGPDRNIDRLHWVFLAAIGTARRSIRIVTPYFLPDAVLTKAIHLAGQRGIEVDIIVPEVGNLPVVRWAMWGNYRQVIDESVRLWLAPPPFDHTKLMVVDRYWCTFGSSNWDPRSLRLNFEFNVECYDEQLGAIVDDHAQQKMVGARLLTREELENRHLLEKIRDGTARLMKPYL